MHVRQNNFKEFRRYKVKLQRPSRFPHAHTRVYTHLHVYVYYIHLSVHTAPPSSLMTASFVTYLNWSPVDGNGALLNFVVTQ